MQTEAPSRNETQGQNGGASKDGTGLKERIHGLETAQAVQVATQAGMTATAAATQVGNMAVMAVGSVSLIVGMFLGLAISRSHS